MLNLSKKILVAIDGSPQSDKAAEEAVRLAMASGSRFKSKVYAILVLPGMRAPSFTDFFPSLPATERVITSYGIHYTKLYEPGGPGNPAPEGREGSGKRRHALPSR